MTIQNKLTASILLTVPAVTGWGFILEQTIDDVYWGGQPNHNSYKVDVIGDSSVFGISQAIAAYNYNSDTMSISIKSNYFDDLLLNSNKLLGTSMGDLFISSTGLSWTTGGSATLNDYYGSGSATAWDYAVKLGTYDNSSGELNQFLAAAGNTNATVAEAGSLHQIGAGDSIELSYAPANYVYRVNQELRLNTSSSPLNSTVRWYISDSYDSLNISIGDFSQFFAGSSDVGFHWTMSCGNDVIEFQFTFPEDTPLVPVPEPSLIGALGMVGLFGILAIKQYRKRKTRVAGQ